MNQTELIAFWLDSAKQDLTVCESLFEKQHYDWCLFVGHLVLEKVLKAHWIREHHPEPHARIHNLAKLAEKIPLALTDEQKVYLLQVNEFFLQGAIRKKKVNSIKFVRHLLRAKTLKQLRSFINGC